MRGHIRERSPGHWAIILDINKDGVRKRKWHAFKGTKREAQAECARLITAMKSGGYVEANRLTVAQYLHDRLTQWEAGKQISLKTAERYRELINNQIIPHLGDKRLQKLGAIDIEAWHNKLLTSGRRDGAGGVSKRTIGHAHRVLSKALREAARFELITKNVAAAQRAPKVDDVDEVAIIEENRLKELMARLEGHPVYPKVIVALFTGMRRGELLALRWNAVDVDKKMLRVREALEQTTAHGVRVKKPKSKAGQRDIALPDIVVDVLREHRRAQLELRLRLGLGKLADDGFVFAELDGSPHSPHALSLEWAKAADAIGMGDITFHALRHTHASQLIAAGVDVVTISKRLGHAKPSITLSTYSHMFRSHDDRAAAAINAALADMGRT